METEPLRIAFATPEYVTEEYYYGGLANYTHRVAKALARFGHDVHVVTLSEIDEAEFEHEGVQVHRVKRGRLHALKPFRLVQFPNYSLCGLVSMFRLRVPHVLRASS